ncbi:acyl-CoA dehydrogenase (plasmid) [Streptomyces alboflavus]|uniref:Acyl-CoA dehydrogenase n=1 Tax=Streptomyces alboflavus TaxID=67267 RepID=A0A291W2W4_9ACTN|nr:acyl-CoA dehydrogenase family protein [Streptomyces alboflavus]ATM24630.1 acyl-CoA dehydrogenase [Streptomyces alboflavus]
MHVLESFLTEEHLRLREEVRAFAEEVVAPRVAGLEASRSIERELPREVARRGWIGATIDTEHGGMGAGHLAKTIIVEELSRVCAAVGAAVQASQLGTAKIIRYGTEEQQRRWLPKIAAGECLPTIAVTEDGSGSHVLGMRATARRDGDDYVLNGIKCFVGNSDIADVHGVVVRTGSGSRGLSAFLVEADAPGVTVSPHEPTLGLHGFSFGEVRFEDVRVPAHCRLGAEGDGRDIAYSSSIVYGRPNLSAVSLGVHQAILEETVAYCHERQLYGKPLYETDGIKHKVGQIQSRLLTARLTAYYAASALDRELLCDPELINAKYLNAESAIDSARTAMEILAAAGLRTKRPLERYLRDALHIFAPAGTSDIQVLRLAEHALGLSKGQYSQPTYGPARGTAALRPLQALPA